MGPILPLLDVVLFLVWTGWMPYSFGSNSPLAFTIFKKSNPHFVISKYNFQRYT